MRTFILSICILLLGARVLAQSASQCFDNAEALRWDGNSAEAYGWYVKAAELGHSGAQAKLCKQCAIESAMDSSQTMAAKWCLQVATSRNNSNYLTTECRYLLAMRYMKGAGVPADTLEAIRWLTTAAHDGHVYSQSELGDIYRHGRGVEADIEEARKWYVMAAENGSSVAERAMAELGMTDYVPLAMAQMGDAESQYHMGMHYLTADEPARDLNLARDWLLRSALNGNPDAMCEVGLLYYAGVGVEENLALAKHFWQRAADLGHSKSIELLDQPLIETELGNIGADSVVLDLRSTCSGGVASNKVRIRPQGAADDREYFYLNEQILLVQHTEMEGVSALRVPEAVGWLGKTRIRRPTPQNHPYQVGQKWLCDGRRLYYENCPLTNFSGPSPGTISCSVVFLTDEIIELTATLTASTEGKIERARCHFCFNHRRAPLLGRAVYARAGGQWVDFERYVELGYGRFGFSEDETRTGLPTITERALYSESVREGMEFGSVIWSRHAEVLVSNWAWPCTDVNVDFGDIEPGASVTRVLFAGLGPGGRDEWRKRVRKIPTD